MIKNTLLVLVAALILAPYGAADDLYEVRLHRQADAEALKSIGVEALFWVRGGYVVLADQKSLEQLRRSSLDFSLIYSDIARDRLVVDRRRDDLNADRFEVVYKKEGWRLLLIDQAPSALVNERLDIHPLGERPIEISYHPTAPAPEYSLRDITDLDSLMDLVSQDSLQSYTERLQAFTHRLTGTDSNYAARDWLEAKYQEFGYDEVEIDPFTGSQLWSYTPVQSYNVLAYKTGSVYPERQIVIGGHFDAVPDCPGADDNASGTAATLELARILRQVETPMTLIFAGWDSEESWMWGSYHYVDGAVARGDDIILMVNPDMIAHGSNDTYANLYHGPEDAYAALWASVSAGLGITGYLSGSTASDHLPFQQAGYDVIFVQEGDFSTHYHQPSDSTTYQDFEYMTRMVKATLATVHMVGHAPPPVKIVAVQEPGDGQSQMVTWRPIGSPDVQYYRVFYHTIDPPGPTLYLDVPVSDTSAIVESLSEGVAYGFFVQAYDADGHTSYAHDELYGTAWVVPRPPEGRRAMPLDHAITLWWDHNNTELDFDRYTVFRDGAAVGTSTDTTYLDDDPTLGPDLHYYQITATDFDGYQSDTVNLEPLLMRAATLEPGRICAVNRSATLTAGLVDEVETGRFMREALDGYYYDYYSDTMGNRLRLIDLLDYGVLVVGAETARFDKLAAGPEYGGILDTLAYYLSIGGQLVLFGRWGDLAKTDTIDYRYNSGDYDDAYYNWMHVERRVRTYTHIASPDSLLSDQVGAFTVADGYPPLVWDSAMTSTHSLPFGTVSGVPCVDFVDLSSPEAEVIYTYDSRDDDPFVEGRPVAWRYLGDAYAYVCFDVPLSFYQRSAAISALRQAVADVMGTGDCCLRRGDINHDGLVDIDIADLVWMIDYMFTGGPPPPCMKEADVDGLDDLVDISDLVYLIDYMFTGGPLPPSCP